MFDSLKSLGQLGPLMAQARQMQEKMAEVQRKIPTLRASGVAGGDMVKATASGTMEILELQFSPASLAQDPELLADLTRAAVNQAINNIRRMVEQEMQAVTGNVDMSAMQKMLGGGTL